MLGTDPALTRSEAEGLFLALVRRTRLPDPLVNARCHGREVDFLWRRQRLVVEIDGWAWHGHRGAFEKDRRRDAALLARGLRVMRVSWRRLVEEPEALAAELGAALLPGGPA